MNTFKEGDRVSHKVYGEGTVENPYSGTGYATVRFDTDGLVMTAERLLTPATPAARFKVGDRVHHAQHGSATVAAVEEDLKLVTIWPTFYRDGETVQVHPISLTHEVPTAKFKVGDRVSHPLHRDGTVEDIQANGLHVVNIGGNRVYMALEHQLREPTTEPKFTVRVMFTDGAGLNSYGPMFQQHAEAYLTQLPDWDNVESITINRVKG